MNSYMTAEDSGAGFKKYLRDIGDIPLITPAEETGLAVRIQAGDDQARSLMIRSNLRLVVKVAMSYTNLGLPLLDLIEEGNIGLMKGIDRFNPTKGAKLSTYVIWWIKQCIKRAIQNQGKIIRLPAHFGDKVLLVRRISTQMSEALGREPTADELSEETGLDSAEITQLRTASTRPASLDAPVADSAEMELVETVCDEREPSPFEALREKDLRAQIDEVLPLLSERERRILVSRFGLGGGSPKTLEDVGIDLGITRERIRQLQKIALEKLRWAITQKDASPVALGEIVLAHA